MMTMRHETSHVDPRACESTPRRGDPPLAVGGYHEASHATGIAGDQIDESAPNAGVVYPY